jgi:hypothetical protein
VGPDSDLWFCEYRANQIGKFYLLSATGTTLTETAGQKFADVVASFHDDQSGMVASNYTALINWGDGSKNSTGGVSDNGDGTWDIAASHRYALAGSYTVTVTITDTHPGGMTTTAISTIQVAASQVVPEDYPLVATGQKVSATAGTALSGVVASFTDADPVPGPAGAYSAVINWGDGTRTFADSIVANGGGNFDVHGTHAYSIPGVYTVSVGIADNDTSHDIGSSTATATATTVVAPFTFADNFEESTLNPFWSTLTNSGSITFPGTTRVHGGNQSVQLNSKAPSKNKDIELFHHFDAPIFGHVSVYVYDTGAGISSSNYIYLTLNNSQRNVRSDIGVLDYDLGPGNGGDVYYYRPFADYTQPPIRSPIRRTLNWHHWEIDAEPQSLTVSIDDRVVYSGRGGTPFNEVTLQMFGPNWRPAWVAYFDDFEVTQSGAGGGLLIQDPGSAGFATPVAKPMPPSSVPDPVAVRALGYLPSAGGGSATTGQSAPVLDNRPTPDVLPPSSLWQGPILPPLSAAQAGLSFVGPSDVLRRNPKDLQFATVGISAEPLDLNGYSLLPRDADF